MSDSYRCPVCGYGGLSEPAWTDEDGGSEEICPSCGFQFGVTDLDRGESYESWREKWISAGMPWRSIGRPRPPGWNPRAQLAALDPNSG